MQKILDAWSTLDPANAAKFYVHGPGAFFDIAPVKYTSWEDYEAGSRKMLAGYQSMHLILNDDAVVHVSGDCAWGTATVKEDAMLKNGQHEMATGRWTVIWEKHDGLWLVAHEHVSEAMQ